MKLAEMRGAPSRLVKYALWKRASRDELELFQLIQARVVEAALKAALDRAGPEIEDISSIDRHPIILASSVGCGIGAAGPVCATVVLQIPFISVLVSQLANAEVLLATI
jgi:hypothetical protein